MASITVRNLAPESKARLRLCAAQRGCSLEALVRSILDQAAEDAIVSTGFPHDLIGVIEAGEEIEPFLSSHDQAQTPFRLR